MTKPRRHLDDAKYGGAYSSLRPPSAKRANVPRYECMSAMLARFTVQWGGVGTMIDQGGTGSNIRCAFSDPFTFIHQPGVELGVGQERS